MFRKNENEEEREKQKTKLEEDKGTWIHVKCARVWSIRENKLDTKLSKKSADMKYFIHLYKS